MKRRIKNKKRYQTPIRYVRSIEPRVSREIYNPLKELTPQRAIELYQAWREGRYADVQLCWDALEEYDDILGTLVDKRTSAIKKLDWSIKISADITEDDTELQALADEQQKYLSALYNKVENLTAAIEWLAMATFRGYAHLEILDSGDKIILAESDQWFWSKPERRGAWYFNPNAMPSHGDIYEVDTSELIIRSVQRPVDIIAMFAITVKAHGEAGWDGFIDVFGNPALFFEYPPNTSDERAADYDVIIDGMIGDGRGAFESGGKIHTVETTAAGGITFQERCDWINKKMVMRGTGGLLTILAESGSGTLAGSAHVEAFEMLAAAEAMEISEVLNRQFTDRYLERKFPGKPKLAYFDLSAEEVEDVTAMATTITTLATAGYRTPDEQVSELTGLNVSSANLDSTALYAAKATGYVPTQQALQDRMGMPLKPVPMMDDSGNPAVIQNVQPMLPRPEVGTLITNNETEVVPSPEASGEAPLTSEELNKLENILKSPITPDQEEIETVEKSLQNALETAKNENGDGESEITNNKKCNGVATAKKGK